MKKILLLLLLFLFVETNAQINSINQQIENLNNKELAALLLNQKILFNKIENFLIENSKINSNEYDSKINFSKFDSINMIKTLELKNIYKELNIVNRYPIKNKKEAELIQNFKTFNLNKIDSLYKLYLINCKTKPNEIKKSELSSPDGKTFPITGEPVVESLPFHKSCAGSPLGENNCTLDYIRKKIAYGYAMPEQRELNVNQLRIILQFRLSKWGKIDIFKIVNSSGYFEYDMEALNILEKISQKEEFTPASQKGKNVHCSYALPLNLMVNPE